MTVYKIFVLCFSRNFQAFNLIHVYDDTVLHSVVPIGEYSTVAYVTPEETAAILAKSGITIAPAANPHVPAFAEDRHPPTRELAVVG